MYICGSKVIYRSWDYGDCPFYGYPNTHVHHQPLSRRTTEPESFEPIPLSCAWCDFTSGDIDGVSCIPAVSHPFLVGYGERGWTSGSDATGCLVFLNVFFMNNWHAKLRQFMPQVPRHRMKFCEWAWPTCSKQTLRQMLHFIILHLYSWVHRSTEKYPPAVLSLISQQNPGLFSHLFLINLLVARWIWRAWAGMGTILWSNYIRKCCLSMHQKSYPYNYTRLCPHTYFV